MATVDMEGAEMSNMGTTMTTSRGEAVVAGVSAARKPRVEAGRVPCSEVSWRRRWARWTREVRSLLGVKKPVTRSGDCGQRMHGVLPCDETRARMIRV